MENAKIEEKNGVDFLLDTVRANPYNITVLAIGPFTNLAAAAERAPETFGKIKRILIMGGDYTSNVPEWNILCDPEAADKVFRSGVPIRAVGFDVTKDAGSTTKRSRFCVRSKRKKTNCSCE